GCDSQRYSLLAAGLPPGRVALCAEPAQERGPSFCCVLARGTLSPLPARDSRRTDAQLTSDLGGGDSSPLANHSGSPVEGETPDPNDLFDVHGPTIRNETFLIQHLAIDDFEFRPARRMGTRFMSYESRVSSVRTLTFLFHADR